MESKQYDLNWQDEMGITLLHYACASKMSGLVRKLLENGAQVDSKISLLKAKVGWQPIHQACETGCLGSLQELLAHGADADAPTFKVVKAEWTTPLHLAAANGHILLIA
jgi:ankyrin repeat protein